MLNTNDALDIQKNVTKKRKQLDEVGGDTASEAALGEANCSQAIPLSIQEALLMHRATHTSIRTRCAVDPLTHKWMDAQLLVWQSENQTTELEVPANVDWYYGKRSEAISKGLLDHHHYIDVLRSYTMNKMRKLRAAQPQAQEPQLAADSADVD